MSCFCQGRRVSLHMTCELWPHRRGVKDRATSGKPDEPCQRTYYQSSFIRHDDWWIYQCRGPSPLNHTPPISPKVIEIVKLLWDQTLAIGSAYSRGHTLSPGYVVYNENKRMYHHHHHHHSLKRMHKQIKRPPRTPTPPKAHFQLLLAMG